ncbi:MAG: cbb3-type cytochrome c oxidase subunit II [Puniceicoccaceae bacterium]
MKSLPLLFLGIFFTLAFAWVGIVWTGNYQIGSLEVTTERLDEEGNLMEGEPLFPTRPVGLAQQGKLVYIREGCMYCHSQQVRPKGFGADIERGWGGRGSVPRDYILQDRVLLGTMRTGPDLTNVGARPLTADWHHQHLYNPQIVSQGSIMPPYAYLYEVREIGDAPNPKAISINPDLPYAPPPGYEVIPTHDAEALVAYLLSLKIDYSLPEASIEE